VILAGTRAKSTFHVSFRPSLTNSYARGERRCAGGYASYSAAAAVGSELSIRVPRRSSETLSPPIPLLSFPHPWCGGDLLQIFLGFLARATREEGRGGGQRPWRTHRLPRGRPGACWRRPGSRRPGGRRHRSLPFGFACRRAELARRPPVPPQRPAYPSGPERAVLLLPNHEHSADLFY
jgi:hypothetical protein